MGQRPNIVAFLGVSQTNEGEAGRKWKCLSQSCLLLSFFPLLHSRVSSVCCPQPKARQASRKPWHSGLPWWLAIFLIMSPPPCWQIAFANCEVKWRARFLPFARGTLTPVTRPMALVSFAIIFSLLHLGLSLPPSVGFNSNRQGVSVLDLNTLPKKHNSPALFFLSPVQSNETALNPILREDLTGMEATWSYGALFSLFCPFGAADMINNSQNSWHILQTLYRLLLARQTRLSCDILRMCANASLLSGAARAVKVKITLQTRVQLHVPAALLLFFPSFPLCRTIDGWLPCRDSQGSQHTGSVDTVFSSLQEL